MNLEDWEDLSDFLEILSTLIQDNEEAKKRFTSSDELTLYYLRKKIDQTIQEEKRWKGK